MNAMSPSKFLRTGKGILLLFLVWSIPVVIESVLAHARMTSLDQPSSLVQWLLDSAGEWYAWGIFTPMIFFLAERFPVNRSPRMKNILLLLVFGAVIVSVHGLLKIASSYWVFSEPITTATMVRGMGSYYSWNSPISMLIYIGIIAGATAYLTQIQLRENQLKASQLEAQFAKAQLDTLQRQLEPHFLFNTLNSVSVLTQKGEIAQANRTLTDLSDLLRYVLQHQQTQKIPLHDELELVRRYVAIEQIRFGSRLHISIDAPNDLLPCLVPSFLLQLLVENAIKHGVAEKIGDGNVSVHIRREDRSLHMRVEDNGNGLKANEKGRQGVGIANARKRLALLYGTRYSFEIRDRESGGVAAELAIPIETADSPAHEGNGDD